MTNESPESEIRPASHREVSNEEVLKTLHVMAESVRAIVAGAIAAPMAEIKQTVQEMREFRDASLPVMSDAIKGFSEAVAVQMAEIKQIAQDVKEMESMSFRGLRTELSDMMSHIDSTKIEIASLRPEDDQDGQIVAATSELDAVIKATETATSEILEQSERIQTIVEKLRADETLPPGIVPHIDDLEDVSTQLLMSCGFQDLTGQRINKVVNTLLYLEQHISTMMNIWQIDRGTGVSHLMASAPDDARPDKDLLNGPQLDGAGVSQNDIDALCD